MSVSESERLQPASRRIASANLPKYKQTQAWIRLRESWVGECTRTVRKFGHEMTSWAIREPDVSPPFKQLLGSIAALGASSADPVAETDSETPIFLFSTGWRSGSTLLQRILVTDPSLLIWGEPLGEMTIVSKLAEAMSQFISPRNLRLWKEQADPASGSLSTSWVANLYPPPQDFRLALRRLFDRWMAEPARQRGFSRWGFKEVRFGAIEAGFLRWLYPNARFVLISRHPYDCYRSLADAEWGEVYYRYPDLRVASAASFARHWNRLAVTWSDLPAGFPSTHIRYEDLVSRKVDFRQLESWLGIEIREGVALSASVGGTATRTRLAWYERLIIAQEAAAGMRLFEYSR